VLRESSSDTVSGTAAGNDGDDDDCSGWDRGSDNDDGAGPCGSDDCGDCE
jgi:hypothetical protein